jgi:hypothetical protein
MVAQMSPFDRSVLYSPVKVVNNSSLPYDFFSPLPTWNIVPTGIFVPGIYFSYCLPKPRDFSEFSRPLINWLPHFSRISSHCDRLSVFLPKTAGATWVKCLGLKSANGSDFSNCSKREDRFPSEWACCLWIPQNVAWTVHSFSELAM